MNLRVLAIPLSFAAAAAALFIVLNILGTPDSSQLAEAGSVAPETTPESAADTTQIASLETPTQDEGGAQDAEQVTDPATDTDTDPVAETQTESEESQPEPIAEEAPAQENPAPEDQGVPTEETAPQSPEAETEAEAEAETGEGQTDPSSQETQDAQGPSEPASPDAGTAEPVIASVGGETDAPDEATTPEAVAEEQPSTDEQTEQTEQTQVAEVQPIEEQPIVEEPIQLVALPREDQAFFGRTMVDEDGTLSILQGSGVAGSVLEIIVDGQLLLTTNVNPSGNWSLYQSAALPLGVNSVDLRSRLGDGRVGLSDQQLVAFLPDDGGAVKGALIDQGQVTVLNAPRFVTRLIIEGVIYTPDGAVLFGKAPAGAEVSFSGGTNPSALIGSTGVWSLNLGPQDPSAGTLGTLTQRSPVTGQDVETVPVSLPAQPLVEQGGSMGLAGGVALGLEDQVILLF